MKKNLMKDKRKGTEGAGSSEHQKAYPTSEFTILVNDHDCMQLRLASRLATAVTETD